MAVDLQKLRIRNDAQLARVEARIADTKARAAKPRPPKKPTLDAKKAAGDVIDIILFKKLGFFGGGSRWSTYRSPRLVLVAKLEMNASTLLIYFRGNSTPQVVNIEWVRPCADPITHKPHAKCEGCGRRCLHLYPAPNALYNAGSSHSHCYACRRCATGMKKPRMVSDSKSRPKRLRAPRGLPSGARDRDLATGRYIKRNREDAGY